MARASISEDRMAVLGEALQEAIAGRRLRAALFTTYTFDPGFFELHVLPNLFDQPFAQEEKIKRVQLEEALRSAGPVAVCYDVEGLSPDATPSHLDVQLRGIRRRTGCFHPKLVFLLVEDAPELEEAEEYSESRSALIVGTLSANLTRAGWWENVETGHFEEVKDRDVSDAHCSYRGDLLTLLKRLRSFVGGDEAPRSFDRIQSFVKERVTKREPAYRTQKGRYHTRLFFGQSRLPDRLAELGLNRQGWNLEVISPYFDHADARVLRELIHAVAPQATRLYLPRDRNGDALVTPSFRDSVAEIADWSDLPASILQRGGAKLRADAATHRRVHAKVYRLWQTDGREVVLTGSVNLTSPAHSASNGGNFEAAFLVDTSADRKLRWWTLPLDDVPKCAEVVPEETEGSSDAYVDLQLRYDWSQHAFEYHLGEDPSGPIALRDSAGESLGTIDRLVFGEWTALNQDAADRMRALLDATSFVIAEHDKGRWRLLVRQEGTHCRPSFMESLSPEEILRYWSLLTDAQRALFIEHRLQAHASLEGLTASRNQLPSGDSVFDRVAGLFHAFEQRYRHLTEAIERDNTSEAVAALYGRKYDSLPVLLEKVLEDEQRDPVMAYLTFLCARQLADRLETDHPFFVEAARAERPRLTYCLQRIEKLRESLLRGEDRRDDFLEWYEAAFSGMIEQTERAAL